MDCISLRRIVASDARGRGASALCRPEFLKNALNLCVRASRVLIVTGFYIRKFQAPETDGPPGAVILGRALARAGKYSALVTDKRNYACLEACSVSVGGPSVMCVDNPEKIPADAELLIFIERPGQAADGRYYNMKGEDISDVVAPLDAAAESALSRGVPVLGIGDGGNEAGMGALRDSLTALLPHYAACLSQVPATVCLPVDISNWGAYALAALLSVLCRRWMGLDENEERVMLEALRKAGAVDGVTGLPALSVDGLALDDHDAAEDSGKNSESGGLNGLISGTSGLNGTTLRIKDWYFGSLGV